MANAFSTLRRIQNDCRKATFLIEKKQLSSLTLREKWELRIHLAGCSICRIFEQQSKMINAMVHGLFHSSKQSMTRLDDEYREQLQHRIDKEMDKS